MRRIVWCFVIGLVVHGNVWAEDLRLKVRRSGSSAQLQLIDIDGRSRELPAGGTAKVNITGGKLQVGTSWLPAYTFVVAPGATLPSFNLRADSLFPETVMISAIVESDKRTFSVAEPVEMASPWWLLLLASVAGGILGSLKDVFKTIGRRVNPREVAGALGLGASIGALVFGLGKVTFLWKLIGIETATDYPQLYLGLALLIALVGVERILDKVFGRTPGDDTKKSEDFSERLHELVMEWSKDLGTKLREELEGFFFRERYLRSYPQLIDRLEDEIVDAKYGELPDGLRSFLKERIDLIYRSSYRKNFTSTIQCNVRASEIVWTQTDDYIYVRSVHEKPDTIEIRPMVEEEIDPAWVDDGVARFGSVVKEIRITVGTAELGYLEYRSVDGEQQLQLISQSREDAPDRIPVTIKLLDVADERPKPLLRFGFEFRFPKRFKEQAEVHVTAYFRWRRRRHDDVYFIRMEQLTNFLTVTCNFPPPVHVETVKYEWRSVREKPPSGPGIARLDDWVLPGHGVCVAWYGVDSVRMDAPARNG